MLMKIYPNYIFKDVTKIDPKVLKSKKLLVFDIDNTLFYSESTDTRDDILKWFKVTNKKYSCVCFSNSFSIKKRKEKIESVLGCKIFLSKHKKPSRELFQEMIRYYNVKAKDVVVIGDFHFTDVLFANRNNATSILVRPIGGERRLSLFFARYLENFVLFILGFFS